ncbi:hypothetical protein J132_09432 [Termitomyces sp. J132]|nr:hypothetical protein J132_09432 [Termitomyces sp. J132]
MIGTMCLWHTVASNEKKETEDVEMGEDTPVVTVAEVEPAASGGEVEGEQEVEEEAMEVEKERTAKRRQGIARKATAPGWQQQAGVPGGRPGLVNTATVGNAAKRV